jgi:predicted O-linked N-acetylglucosamine transferase (SPINDLY family)
VRLSPCFVCYKPPIDSPPVSPAPCVANGFVTFGSFNNLRKINDSLLALWADVLRAAPTSRLMLKAAGLDEAANAESIARFFDARGVSPSRLRLIGYVHDPLGHLNSYAGVDAALDTVPYNGTTTTCEALWMGVPTITLEGNAHVSRVGTSLMHAAGLPEFVAPDAAGYVEIAAQLARSPDRIAAMRPTLRPKMLASPLCDAPAFCREFERALFEMATRSGVV